MPFYAIAMLYIIFTKMSEMNAGIFLAYIRKNVGKNIYFLGEMHYTKLVKKDIMPFYTLLL